METSFFLNNILRKTIEGYLTSCDFMTFDFDRATNLHFSCVFTSYVILLGSTDSRRAVVSSS